MATPLRVPNGIPSNDPTKPMTLTILGCGTLGIAILSGILSSLSHHPNFSTAPSPAYPDSGTATPTNEDGPSLDYQFRTPSNFVCCVRRPQSAKRIKKSIAEFDIDHFPVSILQNENVKGVQQADVVILGCKPYMVSEILSVPGMRSALSGKLLISICAGVTVPQIEEILSRTPSSEPEAQVVRAMPNTAAIVRESMTVIASSDPPLSKGNEKLVNWLFTRIGRVITLPPNLMNISTALCGSGPAFLSLFLEALADGAVAMGLPRAEAQLMAAQTMRGTAGMVLEGEHPAMVREKVSTPGGCTIGGLLVLEEGTVRGNVARAVRVATEVAGGLGSKSSSAPR